jgi:signal transduction histidine kinase
MEILQVLWVEAESSAETAPFWVEQLTQANDLNFDIKTAPSLSQALARAAKSSQQTGSLANKSLDGQRDSQAGYQGNCREAYQESDLGECIIWSGSAEALWQDMEELSRSQNLEPLLPIVLVSNESICLDEELRTLGVREVLYRPTLTRAMLVQTLRYVVQLHRLEQDLRVANRRLRQTDQILTHQSQVLTSQTQHIQRLTVQLAEMAQLKNQFLAMISHELRTPLNAIIGFSQLLCRNTEMLGDRQRDMARRITSNANRLLNLVENLLTFTKIEAGQLVVQTQNVELQQLLQSVLDEVQPAATQKGLTLRLQWSQPLQVTTDPIYLQQVIFNLLTNAVKFTKAGSITVSVEQEANQVAILIRDTGIGMQRSDLQYIFEPFRQVDQSLTRQYQGAGLGLAVTAALVNQLQGKITVKSQQGQGSEFRVELPHQLAPASSMATCSNFRNSVA